MLYSSVFLLGLSPAPVHALTATMGLPAEALTTGLDGACRILRRSDIGLQGAVLAAHTRPSRMHARHC